MRPRLPAKPGWLLFVRVSDVKAAAAKVISLGGRFLVAPSDAPTEYWRAVIADPTGVVIGFFARPRQRFGVTRRSCGHNTPYSFPSLCA
jgi:predicted enzyme related to lactoylglutathione lyase